MPGEGNDSSASEQRPEGLIEPLLPSGMRIAARRPPAEFLAGVGATLEMLKSIRGEAPADGVTDRQAADLAWAMRETLKFCLVKPALSFEPASGEEIHPREISFDDAVYIVRWAVRMPEARQPAQAPVPLPRRECGMRARRIQHGRRKH